MRLAVLLACLAPSSYGFLTMWNHISALSNGLPSGNAHVVSSAHDSTKQKHQVPTLRLANMSSPIAALDACTRPTPPSLLRASQAEPRLHQPLSTRPDMPDVKNVSPMDSPSTTGAVAGPRWPPRPIERDSDTNHYTNHTADTFCPAIHAPRSPAPRHDLNESAAINLTKLFERRRTWAPESLEYSRLFQDVLDEFKHYVPDRRETARGRRPRKKKKKVKKAARTRTSRADLPPTNNTVLRARDYVYHSRKGLNTVYGLSRENFIRAIIIGTATFSCATFACTYAAVDPLVPFAVLFSYPATLCALIYLPLFCAILWAIACAVPVLTAVVVFFVMWLARAAMHVALLPVRVPQAVLRPALSLLIERRGAGYLAPTRLGFALLSLAAVACALAKTAGPPNVPPLLAGERARLRVTLIAVAVAATVTVHAAEHSVYPGRLFMRHVRRSVSLTSSLLLFVVALIAYHAAAMLHLAWRLVVTVVKWMLDLRNDNRLAWMLCFLALVHSVMGAPDEAAGGKSKPPLFSGERAAFTAWLVSFTIWLAYHASECSDLLENNDPEPDTVAELLAAGGSPSDALKKATQEVHDAWTKRNRKLFGALGSAMPSWLMTSLYTTCKNDGLKALRWLKNNFDSVSGSGNDRAAAFTRLQTKYIDSKNDISEQDLRTQYDNMMIAIADIVTAGGARPDELMLIATFETSLPHSYQVIRQLVRHSNHTDLLSYYNDMLQQIRAELAARGPSAHAFSAAATSSASSAPPAGVTTEAVIAALQALGFNGKNRAVVTAGVRKPGARGSGPPSYPSNPCLNCGEEDHTRDKCPKKRTTCRFCKKVGHLGAYCPHNPTSGKRRLALSQAAKSIVDREAGPAPPPSSEPGPSSSALHAAVAPAAPQAQMSESEAQAHAAAAASAHADPAAAVAAYVAALKSYGFAQCASVTSLAAAPITAMKAAVGSGVLSVANQPPLSKLVNAMVDSMATYFVVNKPEYLVRVTNSDPGFTVLTADGAKPILAVGVVHVWIPDDAGDWRCYEVPNVLLMPFCTAILYSVRVMRDLFGFKHDFDSASPVISMPDRAGSLPIHDSGTAFAIPMAFSTVAQSAARLVRPTGRLPSALLSAAGSAFPADSVGTPQSLLYQRLGFPYAQAWRYVGASTAGHNLPPNVVMSTTLPVREAVMRGRARALPFLSKHPVDRTPPPPGAVIYLDFAGPLLPSFPHGFTTYCGAIDAGSLYGRVIAAHTMTKEIAGQTLSLILADIAAKMQSAVPIKPYVVNCDNGSAFISKYFREFLADRQIQLRLSPPYTPQLNAQIESMWCTTFATARVLLAAASLPPSMHPFAMQTARWIENRLPKPSRGNQTPVYMLSKALPNLQHLYTFGCLCLVTLPGPLREGDKHFMDRGAPGLYLGPSEEGQCHIVYVFALRRVLPTAKIRVWEDEFPGLRGDKFRWFPDPPAAGSEGPVVPDSPAPPTNNIEPAPPNDATRDAAQPPPSVSTMDSNASPASSPTSAPPSDFPPSPPSPPATAPSGGPATASGATSATSTSNLQRPKLPKGDSGDPSDPQSRAFQRVLPQRSSRSSNPNYASLAGQAALFLAMAMFTRLNALVAHSLSPPGQTEPDVYTAGSALAFASHSLSVDTAFINFAAEDEHSLLQACEVAAYVFSASIVSTTDLGDIPIPRGYKAATSGPWADYWKAAIDKELAGLIALRTWDLIPLSQVPRGSNLMNCHYVFDVKRLRDATVEKFKARLVADGNTQKYGVDYNRIFATVVKASTIRLVLIIAAARDFNLSQIDIRQAYLQADLPEKLYMRVPPGVPAFGEHGEPLVCRLNRSLYGLKQAGREWGALFASFLTNWGFTRSTIDTCLFTYVKDHLILWILVYVDDCIIVDNDSALRSRFVTSLGKRFPVDDRGELEWMLGVSIRRDRSNNSLSLSQELFIKDLVDKYASHVTAGHARKYDTPIEEGLRLSADDCPAPNTEAADQMAPRKAIYMALVGAYGWLSNMTRSEISHVTSQLARFVSNPGITHFNAAMRVLIYLDGTRGRALNYTPNASLPLHVLVDSSWETKFSCSGAYYLFMGCPFHWFSKTQRSVTLSSAEAEYFGCMLALKDTLWVRQVLLDLQLLQPGPTRMWCDSKSAVDMAFDPVAFKNTKHILRAAEFLKHHTLCGSVTVTHAKGSKMIADILTKGQARPVFHKLIKLLDDYSTNPVVELAD